MVNFFSWFQGVSLTFSDIIETPDGPDYVKILLDRCDKNNFDYILTQIPGFEVLEAKGFSDEEIKYWMDYTLRSSFLIWEMAREKQADEIAFEEMLRQEHEKNADNF